MAFYGRRRKKYRKLKRKIRGGAGGFGGNKQFYRKVKKLAKKMSAGAWRMPKRMYQPPQAFARIRTTFVQEYTNPGTGNDVADFVLKGNSLDDIGATNDSIGAPVWQLAQMYGRYYIWKSKVQACFTDDTNPEAGYGNHLRGFYVWPSTTQPIPELSSVLNWAGGSTAGVAPEDIPHVKYRRYVPTQIGYKGPINIKNQAKTKNLYAYKTDVEKDFTGTISAGGDTTNPTIAATSPSLVWYWHFTGADTQDITESTYDVRAIITVTYFIRFWQPNDFMKKVPEGES